MQTQNQMRGVAAMMLSGFTFVINDSLMKLTLQSLPPYEVLVLRGLAGILFAFLFLIYRGEAMLRVNYFSKPVMLRAMLECVAILTYIIALAKAPIGDVTALFQTTPLLVIAGLVVFQGEKASAMRISLVVLGFVGALLVAQPGRGTVSAFVMLALITAVFAAARDLAARKIASDVPAMVSTFILIVCVWFCSLVCGLLFETWTMPPLSVLMLPIGAGLMMMLGHYFTLVAYRSATAQTVAPFYYSFMVFAVIAGYFIFQDVPNTLGFIGMGVIILSGLAILLTEKPERADVFQSSDL